MWRWLLVLGLMAQAVQAYTPKNALGAVAVSRDGTQLVAAGDNRVLYVLDPATLEVRQRVWLKINPVEIFFNRDGSLLLVQSTEPAARLYDTKTWKVKETLNKAAAMVYAADADVLLVADVQYSESTLQVLTPGKAGSAVLFKVPLAVAALGITPDALRIAVLSKAEKTDKETRDNPPRDLKGVDKAVFTQEHDEKAARVLWFDRAGNQVKERESWYSAVTDPRIVMPDAETLYIIDYSNQNARIPMEGEITLFELDNDFNYGHGLSPNQFWIGSGGLRRASVTRVGTPLQTVNFGIDALPGWPEYFKAFAVTDSGIVYGVTSAYRIVKAKPDGTLEKIAPVY